MTRKHFEAIARGLRSCRPDLTTHGRGALTSALRVWRVACCRVADACGESNPRFRRETFLSACGVETGGQS